jgi:hypothetical protein
MGATRPSSLAPWRFFEPEPLAPRPPSSRAPPWPPGLAAFIGDGARVIPSHAPGAAAAAAACAIATAPKSVPGMPAAPPTRGRNPRAAPLSDVASALRRRAAFIARAVAES